MPSFSYRPWPRGMPSFSYRPWPHGMPSFSYRLWPRGMPSFSYRLWPRGMPSFSHVACHTALDYVPPSPHTALGATWHALLLVLTLVPRVRYTVHGGYLRAAHAILDDCGLRAALERLRDAGYRLTIVGHSLGGGVGVVLTALLTHGACYPGVTCVAYASPPCTSPPLASLLKSSVVAVVHNDDIIPRTSDANLRKLVKALEEGDETYRSLRDKDMRAYRGYVASLGKNDGMSHNSLSRQPSADVARNNVEEASVNQIIECTGIAAVATHACHGHPRVPWPPTRAVAAHACRGHPRVPLPIQPPPSLCRCLDGPHKATTMVLASPAHAYHGPCRAFSRAMVLASPSHALWSLPHSSLLRCLPPRSRAGPRSNQRRPRRRRVPAHRGVRRRRRRADLAHEPRPHEARRPRAGNPSQGT